MVLRNHSSTLRPHGVDQPGQPGDLARAVPPVDDPLTRRLINEGYNSCKGFFCLGLILFLNRLPHLFDHSLDARLDVTVPHAAGFVLSHPFFSRLMNSQLINTSLFSFKNRLFNLFSHFCQGFSPVLEYFPTEYVV